MPGVHKELHWTAIPLRPIAASKLERSTHKKELQNQASNSHRSVVVRMLTRREVSIDPENHIHS